MSSKIGLVLSGGGARGIAHLGMLKAFEEWKINFDIISGTSAGALIGAFYAKNFSSEDILTISKKIKLFHIDSIIAGKLGLIKMTSVETILKTYFPENNFSSLHKPLYVSATDIINGIPIYFSSGQLIPALLASSCIPLIFDSIEYNNTYLVDGGVLNNLPIEPIKDKADIIIAMHVNNLSKEKAHIHFKDILERSFHLALSTSVYSKVNQCAIFLDPPNLSQFSMFDVEKADEIFEYAYTYAKQNEKQIMNIINQKK